MTFNISLPLYEQVRQFIQGHIKSGFWRPGDPVPSESALMVQFCASRMTVNRALRELASEGLVTRIQGSGTTVAQLHKISSRLTIRDIHDEIVERGHEHSCRILLLKHERAEPPIARALNLRSRSKVFHSIIVHSENGVPIQFEDRFVNPAAAPGYLENDFTTVTPTHYLLTHAPLTDASYSIEASLPTPQQARELGVRRSEPCIVMNRRTFSGSHTASTAALVYPGSRYSFDGKIQL